MRKLSEEQLKGLLEAGYETRNVEFKPPFKWGDPKSIWLQDKVTQAVIAMSNTRSGGQVVIGIEEDTTTNKIKLTGVTEDQLTSFEDYDGLKGHIDGFAGETIFDLCWGEHANKKYVIFVVQEFEEKPLICRNNGQIHGNHPILRKDDIYVRTKRAPYSSTRATESELIEIIRMAVDKEKSNLESRGWVKKGSIRPEDFYKKQAEDLLS